MDNNYSVAGKDTRTPSIKKLRLSSPVSDLTPLPSSSVHDTDMDDNQFVPTSQSEEQELTLPRTPIRKDPVFVQESVDKWRKETLANQPSRSASPAVSILSSPFSELSEIPMDVDCDPPQPQDGVPDTPLGEGRVGGPTLRYPHWPCSVDGMDIPVRPIASTSTVPSSTSAQVTPVSRPDHEPLQRNSSVPDASPSEAFRSLTPPPSSDLDMGHEPAQETPQVVEVLDEASKTAKLIADIKARAYASVHSSPEQPTIDLDALNVDDDSDSSSDEDVAALIKQTKSRGKAKAPAKAAQLPAAPQATQKYNLRRNSPSYRPKTRPTTPPPEARKPSKKAPIEALLREKKREERTGKGMALVRAGEEIIAQSRAGLDQEMQDDEDDSDSDFNWETGLRVLDVNRRSMSKASSSAAGPSRSQKSSRKSFAGSDEESDDDDQKPNAVGDILAKDMKENMARELAKQKEVPLGVPLWVPMDEADREASMDVESTLPVLAADVSVSGTAALRLLKRATEQNDVAQLSALLTSGLVTFLHPLHYSVIVPWLVDLAFSYVSPSLTTLAYTQLVRLAPRVGCRRSGFSTLSVLRVLVRLGASVNILQKYRWAAPTEGLLSASSDAEDQRDMVHRLAVLVDAFVLSFPTEELSDILLAMVLIGMDPTTSEDLRTELRKACDSVEQAMGLAQQVELDACKKLVAFGQDLSPPNQALLVSFISGTSTSTVHMARCVARSLLLGKVPSSAEYQKTLPDLWPVIVLLTPESGSCGHFDIPGNTDKEGYYDDLTCWLSVLSRVLSDIDEYTLLETRGMRKVPKKSELEGADKENDEEKEKELELEPKLTLLQQVSRSLDLLHGKIVDTRAAHLDRSRAKAAIQRLSFRVHYQRAATLKSREGGKPDLRKYFKPS
ncbi:hypothetical protein GSI_01749 [Ganoderma sinense ZZ0214-1]|uniref:Uncharacterized protein n=1 Tax=Ganoderma sinense ZZ0214-1 TaxID=1077348 RepID=A0A2G8SQP4_9APHY|nr:hypothetical protein GSI_01749 [Ganoderma sinense ZZ0214-1]